jgi:hypothetical protein
VNEATAAESAAPVFISHAGADWHKAQQVGELLTRAGVSVLIDRATLRLGGSFLAFMERALKTSSYCLLLWSRAAAESQWVEMEWQSALSRSARERRSFLVTGRLEDWPPPELLQPRLFVDLFPDPSVGSARLAETWQGDRRVAALGKPVAAPTVPVETSAAGDEVYLTSELFDFVVPVRVSLAEPAGFALDRFVKSTGLPKVLEYQGRIGTRFSYTLVRDGVRLPPNATLSASGVTAGSVLVVETQMTPFSANGAIHGAMNSASFRSNDSTGKWTVKGSSDEMKARAALGLALRTAGLRV